VARVERLTWLCVLGFRKIRREDAMALVEQRLAAEGLLAKASG
jgi:hypothetical protein